MRRELPGVDVHTPDLPLTTLDDDVRAVRAVLDALHEPVVLVGHSYGGAVVTAAGGHPLVRRLVYVAAFQLDAGESVSRVCRDRELPLSEMDLVMRGMVREGAVVPDLAVVGPLLFDDPDAAGARDALTGMRPVSTALFKGVPDDTAWRRKPSTYVVCARDRTVAPALQRAMAERADNVLEWDCGHMPLVERPAQVARVIAG